MFDTATFEGTPMELCAAAGTASETVTRSAAV
jgi:hypothetical protein